MGVMAFGQSQVEHVSVEIGVALWATMLGVGKVKITWSLGKGIAQVVQGTADRTESIGLVAAIWARPAFVISAAFDDLWFGQILDTADSLGQIGLIGSWLWHVDMLRKGAFAGFIDKFSQITSEKLCNVATVSPKFLFIRGL